MGLTPGFNRPLQTNMKKALLILASFSILGLAACGGGDSVDPIDKYLGTWEGCISNDFGSHRETLGISKTSATTAQSTVVPVNYLATACAGTGSQPVNKLITFDLQGTKAIETRTIGAQTVDKVIITDAGVQRKDIFLIFDSMFRFSPGGGPEDAEGYPNTLDTNFETRK